MDCPYCGFTLEANIPEDKDIPPHVSASWHERMGKHIRREHVRQRAELHQVIVDGHTIEGYVWCLHLGTVHEDIEDPETNGPQYVGSVEGPEWVERTDAPGYPGTLIFYVCPGPHDRLVRVP